MGKKYLVYEGACTKCTFLSNMFRVFDIRSQFTNVPIRSAKARDILHEYYKTIPYNFHFVIEDKEICYTGLKAIPVIFFEVIKGFLWPFGSKGPYWLRYFKK